MVSDLEISLLVSCFVSRSVTSFTALTTDIQYMTLMALKELCAPVGGADITHHSLSSFDEHHCTI